MSRHQNQESGITLFEDPNDKEVIAAKRRIHEYILGRIPLGDSIILFFSNIAKECSRSIGSMCVCYTKGGAVLYFNPEYVNSLSDQELFFSLVHEFVHLATDTFRRTAVMQETRSIPNDVMAKKIAPYFDIVVNDMIKEMPGFTIMEERIGGLLYSGSPKVPAVLSKTKTIEQVADRVLENIDDIPEINDGAYQFMLDHSDASEDVSDEILAMAESAMNNGNTSSIPGTVSNMINKMLNDSTVEQHRNSKALWSKVKNSIRVTRATVLQRKRTMRRINRRTLLPPGRMFEKGFNVLFLLDESGSVCDKFIRFAFNMVEHAAIGDKSDMVYVAHWDTSLVELEKFTKGKKPNLERKACGGTAFGTIYTHPDLRKLDIDMCVVVTDGYSDSWPVGKMPYPTIWLINEEPGYRRWENSCGVGMGLYVPSKYME